MVVSTFLALALETLALTVLGLRFRATAWVRPGCLFVIVAVLYSGVPELLVLTGMEPRPRPGWVTDGQVADWLILEAAAVLLFAGVYAALSRGRPARFDGQAQRLLDWRPLLAVAVVLGAYLAIGQGPAFDGSDPASRAGTYWTAGLVAAFLPLLVALTVAAVVRRFGRWTIAPALAGNAVLLALTGQRLNTLAGLALTLVALRAYDIRLGRRLTLGLLVGGAAVFLAIGASRAALGRQAYDHEQGASARLSALGSGLTHLSQADHGGQDLASRLDSNTWGALVLARSRPGNPLAGTSVFRGSANMAVPHFLYAGKGTYPGEKTVIGNQIGIETASSDWLQGQMPNWLAMFGVRAFLPFSALAGLLFAAADRVLGRPGGERAILALGLVAAVTNYEKGDDIYAIELRGAIVLAVVLAAARLAPAATRRRKAVRSTAPGGAAA